MDFKSLMSAQIAKSKSPATNGASKTSKYHRRADIEAERQKAYVAEQARIEAEREERAAKKRKLEVDDAEKTAEREAKLKKLAEESKARREEKEREEERQRRKRLGLPDPPPAPDTEAGATGPDRPDIPNDELHSLLRALNEPAILYNESHHSRLTRYYTLTQPTTTTPQLSNTPIPTTLPLLDEKDMLLPTNLPQPHTPSQTHLYHQIASYFTLLLTNWSTDLCTRAPETADSASGRAALANYNTVLTDLAPLYRHLENATLPPTLLAPLCDIIRHAQMRRYVSANDAYLTLSIGKAAWPIGVTMVGIHERSAREKLNSGEKGGHILGDEGLRKMVQGVKRCLSYAQVRWPPEDRGQLMG